MRFKNKRYLIKTQDVTIEEHGHFCRTHGMKLGVIRDESENDFISRHVDGYLRLGAIWNRAKKSFQWEDGSEMNYTNWDSGPICYEPEDCCTIEMVPSGTWDTFSCRSEAFALCEQSKES